MQARLVLECTPGKILLPLLQSSNSDISLRGETRMQSFPAARNPLCDHNIMSAGRAERLGLAISLVSLVEEKVWYCRAKGYKPWLKPTAKDVKTHEQGGHTIWYNEQQLLKVRNGLAPVSSMQNFCRVHVMHLQCEAHSACILEQSNCLTRT